MADDTLSDRIQNIDEKNLGTSLVFAFIPAIGLASELAIATPGGWTMPYWLPLPLVGFTYLLYRQRPVRNKGGSVLYYLSIELFLLPVAMLLFVILRDWSAPTGIAWFAAGIVGVFFVGVAAVIGVCGGVALYLISKRVLVEKPSGAEVGE